MKFDFPNPLIFTAPLVTSMYNGNVFLKYSVLGRFDYDICKTILIVVPR